MSVGGADCAALALVITFRNTKSKSGMEVACFIQTNGGSTGGPAQPARLCRERKRLYGRSMTGRRLT